VQLAAIVLQQIRRPASFFHTMPFNKSGGNRESPVRHDLHGYEPCVTLLNHQPHSSNLKKVWDKKIYTGLASEVIHMHKATYPQYYI
jgi:hypothetical protein